MKTQMGTKKQKWLVSLLIALLVVISGLAGQSIERSSTELDSIEWKKEAIEAWTVSMLTAKALNARREECRRLRNVDACVWQFRKLQLELIEIIRLRMPAEFKGDTLTNLPIG